jgi:hypothetical protein
MYCCNRNLTLGLVAFGLLSVGTANFVSAQSTNQTPAECAVIVQDDKGRKACFTDKKYAADFLEKVVKPAGGKLRNGDGPWNPSCKWGCCLYEAGDGCLDCCDGDMMLKPN